MEKIDYLIDYLLKEKREVKLDRLPQTEEEKKKVFRSLCNIREPGKISNEFLKVQDEYLQEELKNKNVTDVKDIKTINTSIKNSDKMCLWKGDITTLKIDAIVNAANSRGLGCFIPCHKCIDNQIHTFSGIELRNECDEIMKEKNYYLPTGEAFITKGYNLPAKYVIHTVGPIVYGEVTKKEEDELINAYTNSLELAKEHKIRTIAFPCISTGEFRFPKDMAVKYAFLAVEKFLDENRDSFDKIVFNVFSEEDSEIYESYIKQNSRN